MQYRKLALLNLYFITSFFCYTIVRYFGLAKKFEFFHKRLWKNLNEVFGQLSIISVYVVDPMKCSNFSLFIFIFLLY